MSSHRPQPPSAPMPEPISPALLTIYEVCATLNLSRTSVYRLVDANRLRRVRLGGVVRVTSTSVAALLADLEAGHDLVIRQRTPAERRREAAQRAERNAQQRAEGGAQ